MIIQVFTLWGGWIVQPAILFVYMTIDYIDIVFAPSELTTKSHGKLNTNEERYVWLYSGCFIIY